MPAHSKTDIDEYLKFLANVLHRSPHTIKAYRELLYRYAEYLTCVQRTSARCANVTHVAAFITHIADTAGGYAPRSIRQKMSILASFHNWMQNMEMRTSNPVALLDRPKRPQLRPLPPTDGEIVAMRAAIVRPDRAAAFALMADVGLRAHETVTSLIENIDLDAGLITVDGKGSRTRTVAIRNPQGIDAIRAHIGNRKHGYVLASTPNRKKPHINPLTLIIWTRAAAKAAQLRDPDRFHPHALRHYLADRMNRAGHDAFAIQHQLGHATPDTTSVYVHPMRGTEPGDMAIAKRTLQRLMDRLESEH